MSFMHGQLWRSNRKKTNSKYLKFIQRFFKYKIQYENTVLRKRSRSQGMCDKGKDFNLKFSSANVDPFQLSEIIFAI